MYFKPWQGLGLVYVIYMHTVNILLALAGPEASICYIYIYIHTVNVLLALAGPEASICYIYIYTYCEYTFSHG